MWYNSMQMRILFFICQLWEINNCGRWQMLFQIVIYTRKLSVENDQFVSLYSSCRTMSNTLLLVPKSKHSKWKTLQFLCISKVTVLKLISPLMKLPLQFLLNEKTLGNVNCSSFNLILQKFWCLLSYLIDSS